MAGIRGISDDCAAHCHDLADAVVTFSLPLKPWARPSGPTEAAVKAVLGDGTTIEGSHLLPATGRRSNSDLLGPDRGIATDDRGFLTIDNRFQTLSTGRVWPSTPCRPIRRWAGLV